MLPCLQPRLDRELDHDLVVAEPDVRELLVAEVLDHLDGRVVAARSRTTVAEPDVLRAEAGELPGAADAEHRRGEHVHRRRADEAGDERVGWMLVQLLGRPELLQLALVHDRDAVAHRHRLDLVMRDVDGGGAEALLQPEDLGARLDAQRRVEVGERLVHEERLRLTHDRAPERDPLALTAGELPRLPLQEVAQLQHVGRLAGRACRSRPSAHRSCAG